MNQGFQRFLRHWFATPAGKVVLNQEKQLVDAALENMFGYFLVQLGCVSEHSLVDSSRVSCKLLVDENASWQLAKTNSIQWVQAEFDFLPIGRDKIDVAFLPHTLESVDDPYYILRQVDNMLLPEGHIVLTGFNNIGCLPLTLKFFSKRHEFASASFRRPVHLKEWLKVLGYEVQTVKFTSVMCFSSNEKYTGWVRFIEVIERSLRWIGLDFGNVYCLVAKKKVDSPTLVGAKWHLPRWQAVKNGSVASSRIKSAKKQSSE